MTKSKKKKKKKKVEKKVADALVDALVHSFIVFYNKKRRLMYQSKKRKMKTRANRINSPAASLILKKQRKSLFLSAHPQNSLQKGRSFN